ncbi:DMT family transporter [Piscinibacter terrae]|uniref:DMT family transporter n=1 Tax=Piscinibacter terrae TaxID=2496871 RepID=A0A3N7HHQ8_9BURK|nr:DMT family transporter [Albitalea terrae]RQP21584.1 DMT family transporter [Albitalea terrae]
MAGLRSWHLFAICVLVWGTTWHAITYQIGHTTPEVGVALRFGLAGLCVLAMCLVRGERLGFALVDHGRLALQGVFMYGVSYICVYQAERHLPSGLVAVGYSASPLLIGLGAQLLFGMRVTGRFVAGGVLGLVGVALMFWPEFGKAAEGTSTALGAVFTVGSVLLSAIGSLTASRNRTSGLPFWPALGWGMVYGALAAAVIALAQGQSFALPSAPSWWISLLYLALAGSVLTFACYLTLQDRIGPGPSGTIGVMTPLLALVVSMLFEAFRPDLLTFAGAALAVAGNALMLRRPA